MSRTVEHDRRNGDYLVVENGKPLTDSEGRPLRFEDHQRAEEVAKREDGGR
jgi:hypothetical protein